MTIYAGLDVSDKTTHVCVVDGEGVVVRENGQENGVWARHGTGLPKRRAVGNMALEDARPRQEAGVQLATVAHFDFTLRHEDDAP